MDDIVERIIVYRDRPGRSRDGRDLLAELLPAARDYLQRMNQRPHVVTVNADRKTNTSAMLARYA